MKKLILALAIHLSLSAYAMSSELVYTPINPSFGGSALNGSFLLSKAQAQNQRRQPAQRLPQNQEWAHVQSRPPVVLQYPALSVAYVER